MARARQSRMALATVASGWLARLQAYEALGEGGEVPANSPPQAWTAVHDAAFDPRQPRSEAAIHGAAVSGLPQQEVAGQRQVENQSDAVRRP